MRTLHFLLLYLTLLLPLCISGNELYKGKRYYFKTLDINDGLSQNTVHAILQDKQGFMWFGTKDGLNRYDGLSFQIFMKENGSLGNNFVTALHEDEAGNIWVGTDAGVYVYSPKTESFEHFLMKSNEKTIIERSVSSIDSDKKGGIWISVDKQGLFYYDPLKKRLINYLFKNSKQVVSANVTRFWFDSNGTCWISLYADNLYYTKDRFKTLIPFTSADGDQPFKDDIINKIVWGPYNCLYIGSAKGGLKEVNLTTKKVHNIILEDEHGDNIYVREITFYSDDELWIGTESGVFIYHLRTGDLTHLLNDDADPYSLSDNATYSLYKDREGGMWIGSYFGGINYYPKRYTYFEKFYPRANGSSAFGKRVREFCEGIDGTLWIGTEDKGLFNYNPATGNIKPFSNPAIYHNVHGLCLDGNSLWVGTFSKGLNRIDLRTKSVKSYRKGVAPNTLSSNDIFTICRSASGDIWIGSTFGLMRYNRQTDDFTRIKELNGVFVYDLKEDFNGNLWLATYANGVYCFDVSKKKWKNYTYDKRFSNSLPYDKVLSIFEDSRKRLWFTTQGKGFCRFNPDTKTFTRYNSTNGLPNNVVHQIVEDDHGLFWITTNKGLARFNPETNEFKVFTVANGLLSNQFNYQSSYKDKNGKIYLGSINGFISFDPSTFAENTFVPPVVITDFLLFNKKVPVEQAGSPLRQSITMSDDIELKANQNSFSFRIAALSYQAPQMNQLMYKLEGFDKEWYSADKTPVITYSNLPYGTYTFMVKGSNCDGLWNKKATLLRIHILPPFYLSYWAYTIYILLLILFTAWIILYFKRRTAQKHHRQMEQFEQEKERELYTAKIDFFTNVAHEIRTPLTLIKSPLENVLQEKQVNDDVREDLLIMSQNTNRLLDLTNQLLDFRKTESQGFKLSFVECSISDILRTTYIRFTPLAKQKGLDFSITLPETELRASGDREALTKIISNLFTNAVKNADTYIHVHLCADESNTSFCISVSNDGKVIPTEMREEIFKPFVQYKVGEKEISVGTGIGLALSRSLAELHQGSLRMNDSLEHNCFCLTLPIVQQQTIVLSSKTETEEIDMVKELAPCNDKQKSIILVVEDNADMLIFISRQLSPHYTVLTAANGLKALEMLDNNYVNLIVSDIMMPQMDGLELCNQLKSNLTYSHIPIILLTAKTNMQAKIEGLKSGADAYIEKPFSVEYLKACISNLLNNREKLRTAFMNSPFVPSNTMAITKADENFLKTLNEMVLSNMQNPDFCLDDMANILNMSRSSLNRKIKGTLDLTPNDYIRLERLKKAAQLLKEGECKVNEVCYMVGFNTPSYFTKCFQKQFGVLPKDFAKPTA